MNDTGKGIIMASVIVGASMIICVVLTLGAAKKCQDTAIHYLAKQKAEALDILRAQKRELRNFERNREARLRNFVRDELKKMNIEAKVSAN